MLKKTPQWNPGRSSLLAKQFEPSSPSNFLTLFDIVHWKPISLQGGTTPLLNIRRRRQQRAGFSAVSASHVGGFSASRCGGERRCSHLVNYRRLSSTGSLSAVHSSLPTDSSTQFMLLFERLPIFKSFLKTVEPAQTNVFLINGKALTV